MPASAISGFDRAKDIDPDTEELIQEAIFTNTNDSIGVDISESTPVRYSLGDAIALCLNRTSDAKTELQTEISSLIDTTTAGSNSLQAQINNIHPDPNDLTLAPAVGSAVLNLRKGTGVAVSAVFGFTGTSSRWQLHLGDGSPETGSDAGSNFGIY